MPKFGLQPTLLVSPFISPIARVFPQNPEGPESAMPGSLSHACRGSRGNIGDNGKEHGNYHITYGTMEKKMETTILYRG